MRHPWWFLATTTAFLSSNNNVRWSTTLSESSSSSASTATAAAAATASASSKTPDNEPLDRYEPDPQHNNIDDDDDDHDRDDPYHAASNTDCPFYGCPLSPQDVHYNTDPVKHALEKLRRVSRRQGHTPSQRLLATAGNKRSVTLTLIGYKGGPLHDQINQDRALVVNPFKVSGLGGDDDVATHNPDPSIINGNSHVLLGVFDGHAPKGEEVSEFTKSELPVLLSKKLSQALRPSPTTAAPENNHNEGDPAPPPPLPEDTVKQILIDTFVELDARAPAEDSGGCTATIVLKLNDKVYVANAGDSRSVLASYRSSTGETAVLYVSREDKPSLPDEKARVEAMGGQVYLPVRGTSRVVYHDPRTGAPSGLAMSRSIGDWAAGKLGVIPDPIVDAFDLSDLVGAELVNGSRASLAKGGVKASSSGGGTATLQKKKTGGEYVIELLGGNVMATKADDSRVTTHDDDNDDVYIFAFCATDGMMDYLEPVDIAAVLGKALYDEAGAHPLTAAEHLVFAAANAWQQDKQGRYRDDIAIAVSTLRTPPSQRRKPKQRLEENTAGERNVAAAQ